MAKPMISNLLLLLASEVYLANATECDLNQPDCEMDLVCPILTCEENQLEGNKCYQHDGNASAKTIKGALCYDVESAKQADKKLVCPFDTKEYMWIDEILQGQQNNEQNMKCKSSPGIDQTL